MNKLAFTAALGATSLALAGCGDQTANEAAGPAGDPAAGGESNATQTAAAAWPRGARIVEEDGVTFRVDPDGTRVRLTDTGSRIVVENGVRFRTDPDGTRVRIDDQGLDVDVDVDLPDVDVGINDKGNPDVDVGDRDKDGGR